MGMYFVPLYQPGGLCSARYLPEPMTLAAATCPDRDHAIQVLPSLQHIHWSPLASTSLVNIEGASNQRTPKCVDILTSMYVT